MAISAENAGVSAARNAAMELATGEYVLMVDSDDWIEPDMVSTLVENIRATGADISCCQYDKTVRSDIGVLEKWEQRQALETFIVHPKINGSLVNKLIKRDVVEGLQFDSSIRYGEDALFFWKVLLRASSLCITNRVLYHVVMHNDSTSGGGSYKPICKDCIIVWSIIADEAAKIDGFLGNMAFFSLYWMAVHMYNDQEQERYFQRVLRSVCGTMRDTKFIPHSEKIMATIYSRSIRLGNYLVSVKKKLR